LKQKPPKLSNINNNNNTISATTININAQLTRIEDLKPPDNFDYIETSINNHLNELKQETSKCQLRPLITIKNSNTNTYTNESPPESAKTRQITTPTIPIITTTTNTNNNNSQKLDDLNIYYDYRFSSSDNQYLASTNPSTIYRLQKVLSVPKLNKEENNTTNLKTKPPTNLKLNETFMLMPSLNNEKISPKTTYRLSKPIIAKPETFYKPAVSYISNDNNSKTMITNQENSSLSNTNSENRSSSSTDDSTEIKKITEIEQIRHKLKEEYNNLLLGSNKLIVRPKSATICTPTIQYLRSTIKKHDTNNNNNLNGVQDELKIISLNKLSNGSTQSFASATSSNTRPNSAVTFKTKNQFINNNNNNKLRANKPHYIDCESDDLAVELEKSICQFKYDSTLAINPIQAPVNPRNSKLSFYNNNNNNDQQQQQQQQQQTPKIYVTNPIKHVMIKNNINPIENILTYAAINKQPDTICINGKSMSNMSAVEFEHNVKNCFFF
jgi:hypothetical protein